MFELTFEIDPVDEAAVQAIYANSDAMHAVHGSTTLLTITSEGRDVIDAARSCVLALENDHGVVVHRVYEDLVSRMDIAERTDTTPQAVGQWIRGTRHRGTPFPQPHNHVSNGVWLWGDVVTWLQGIGRAEDELLSPTARDITLVNAWLLTRESHADTAVSKFEQTLRAGVAFTRDAQVAGTTGVATSRSTVSMSRTRTFTITNNVAYGAAESPRAWERSDYEMAG